MSYFFSNRQCTEVRFASFLSGGFITAIVVNPPEMKLAKRTSVQCAGLSLEIPSISVQSDESKSAPSNEFQPIVS